MSPESTDPRTEVEREFDRREAAAIAYAIDIDTEHVLIDEREGRATDARHDVPVTRVVGILPRTFAQEELRSRDGTRRAP